MKNIKTILSLMILMALGLGSCNDDLAQPPVNNPGIHNGDAKDPMSCYQVQLGTTVEGYTSVWVTGYIVGCVNTNISNTCSDATATFTVPAPVQTNILMADNPNETDWTKCISVQLPSGPVRNALSLGVAANKGKEVTILGTIGAKYCGVYGVKGVSAYKWGDKGDESIDITAPDTPAVGGDSETIYTALNPADPTLDPTWTIDNVSLGEGLTYVWSWKEYNGSSYLNASAYLNSKANPSTAYCYSPVISLEGYKAVSLNFEHAAKFQTTIKELCKAVVREEGSKDWIELEIKTWPGTTSWAFVNSGEIDITAFAGKKVQVGFKYASSDAGADTWEIKSLTVSGIK